ncbi:Hypothetical protein A7982_03820 [Minicystis rosea]|nr:Hypothetical protein A7982_03820 [Minicystis rosea]
MIRRSLLVLSPFASAALLLAACNSITGVDDLETSGSSSGMTGGGNGNTSASTGGSLALMVPAKGVQIQEIAIYQGVKRSLMGGTPPTSGIKVPVVAARPALLRVFVKIDPATYDHSPVTARLTLGNQAPIEVAGVVSDSTDAELQSTLNFNIPAEKMVVGQTYRVELQQPIEHASPPSSTVVAYPLSAPEPLDVQSDGMQLKVKLVPVKYGADGSNRLPDTSQQQIEGYKNAFFSTYPAANVEITVRTAINWSKAIDPFGNGWGEILDAIANLRESENAPADVYYFGVFNPKQSFDQFCAQGCVAGLGMVGGPQDTYSRAAVGLGYPGDMSWSTAIHEIGHTQGRNHAPCGGAQGVDSKFPYKNGGIGVWGYDLLTQRLYAPTEGKDIMGYCDPYWISDYTYEAIFQRMKTVNNADFAVPDALKDLEWERARVGANGELTWLSSVQMERPPMGQLTPVTEQRAGSATTVDGHFFPYDHLPGGVLLWPKSQTPIKGIKVLLDGKPVTLTR